MRAAQISWSSAGGWGVSNGHSDSASLVLYFGSRQAMSCGSRYDELRTMFPTAHILGCSTGGQIRDDDVTDDEVVAAVDHLR